MKILLTGGGSGGHITPLFAVAHELKQIDPDCTLIAACEKDAQFLDLFGKEPRIKKVYQIPAGKYRRYSGLSRLQKMVNIKTALLNVRDMGRTVRGVFVARAMLKKERPDVILIKGGFVGVPVGLAAAQLGIPYITHDSDVTPGLANRLIARWARLHATGMPEEYYNYPKETLRYTGVPIKQEFTRVSVERQAEYKEGLGLKNCALVISVIGGSQGGMQLNLDIAQVAGRLMQRHKSLGIVHIVGAAHEEEMKRIYANELLSDERARVVVRGFVHDPYRYTGAADVVVSRASATVIAELAVQAKAAILVPGQLADDHQQKNARLLMESGRALMVPHADAEGLFEALDMLLKVPSKRTELAQELHKVSKQHAARDLAELVMSVGENIKRAGR